MTEVKFQEDEYVILRQDKVFPDSILPLKTDEAILTNMNFIYVYKNLFGSIQNVEYIPLKDIAVRRKQAQVTESKKHKMIYLEISLPTRSFLFGINDTGDIPEWRDTIKEIALANSEDKRVIRCDSCGANISGYEGQVITCEYCQAQVKI